MKKTTGNLNLIKKINRSLVLEAIREEGQISRAKIAKKVNLSRSTVSLVVEDLLSKKLVIESGFTESTNEGGRRGVSLKFNPKSAYALGVDIGGTKILVVLTYLDGEVVYKKKFETTSDVKEIINIIKESLSDAGVEEKKIVGMGVGVPSIVDAKNGIVFDAYALGWTNLHLKELLEERFTFPIFINNDVNLAALGERWLGSGKQSDNMFFIAIGTGVGSAIISNGELLLGHKFLAGEIAYNITAEDIKKDNFNRFGEFGVFEKKISGKFLAQQGYQTHQLFDEYESGNPEAKAIVSRFIMELSINIANSVNLLNPEKVVIGGGVSGSMGTVLNDIQKNVNMYTPIPVSIELASLRGDAGGIGAIAYALKEVEVSDSAIS